MTDTDQLDLFGRPDQPDDSHQPGPVGIERDGDVAVLIVGHPPLNMFDEGVRRARAE